MRSTFGRSQGSYSGADPTLLQREEAEELADDTQKLRSRLRDPLFREACFRKGVDPQQIMPKAVADFKTDPTTTREMAERSERLFEEHRRDCIVLAVVEAERLRSEIEEKESRLKQREDELARLLDTRLSREKASLDRIARARSKYEAVVDQENASILSVREHAAGRLGSFHQRHRQISIMRAERKQDRVARQAARVERQRRGLARRRAMEEGYRQKQRDAISARDTRVERFIKDRERRAAAARTDDTAAVVARKRRTQLAKERAVKKREDREAHMARKTAHMERQRQERLRRFEEKKMQRRLLTQRKQQRAARIQASQAYEKKLRADKMAEDDARMERMKEINRAIHEQRRALLREEKIRRDHWKERTKLERTVTPGPGAYTLPDQATQVTGGRWGTQKVSTFLDRIAVTGGRTPGPGQYASGWSSLNKTGGVMASRVPSQLDHTIRRAKDTPGPGHYQPKPLELGASQKFSSSSAPGMLDMAVRQRRDVPGPGQYTTTYVPKKRHQLKLQRATKDIVTVALMLKKLGYQDEKLLG
jgi:hypothetical protein